jgi:hypothetical protein
MNSPTPTNAEAFIAELEAAVNRIPIEQFARVDILEAPDVTRSEIEALKGIADLESSAQMGESAAIRALVRIGNKVTEILEKITEGKDTSPVHFPSATISRAEKILHGDYSRPRIHFEFQGDLDEVQIVLSKWRSQIREDFQNGKGSEYWTARTTNRRMHFTAGRFLYADDFSFTHHPPAPNAQSRQRALDEWNALSGEERWERLGSNDPTPLLHPHESASRAISKLVDMLIGNRIYRLYKITARRSLLSVAGTSLIWPTRFSALPYLNSTLNELPGALRLGSELPFRLHRAPGEPGVRPQLEPNSAAGFALFICHQILEQRQRFRNISKAERLAAKTLSREFDTLISQHNESVCRGGQSIDYCEEHFLKLAGTNHSFTIGERWKLNAILLPSFPKAQDTPGAKAGLAHWKQVAIEYAEWICDGNWEEYEWPRCVTKAMERDSSESRVRKGREIVGTQLHDGIKVLRPK